MQLNMEITFTPQLFISYEKFVEKCVKDSRQELSFEDMMMVTFQNPDGQLMVFKIDGADIDKRVSDRNFYVSYFMLKAYDKTPSQFLDDWKKCHKY